MHRDQPEAVAGDGADIVVECDPMGRRAMAYFVARGYAVVFQGRRNPRVARTRGFTDADRASHLLLRVISPAG